MPNMMLLKCNLFKNPSIGDDKITYLIGHYLQHLRRCLGCRHSIFLGAESVFFKFYLTFFVFIGKVGSGEEMAVLMNEEWRD